MDLCRTAKAWSVTRFSFNHRDQSVPRTGEPRHHGTNRHLSRLGDLAIIKAFNVAQHERLAERRRERRDCRAELFGVGFGDERRLRRWRIAIAWIGLRKLDRFKII